MPASTAICDTHAHVFPPGYALSPNARYRISPHSLADYRAMAEVLDIRRTVFVTPSAYGTDNRSLVDTLRQCPAAKGVASVDAAISDRELHHLAAAGVAGIRLPTALEGPLTAAVVDAWATRLAGSHAMHIDLLLPRIDALPPLLPAIERAKVPIVLDHLGRTRPPDGVSHPSFLRLLGLLEERDHVWVKISSWYRLSSQPPPHSDMAAIVRKLVSSRADRLLWATNWPHAGYQGPPVDDRALLEQAKTWFGDPAATHAILAQNPARLYDFPL